MGLEPSQVNIRFEYIVSFQISHKWEWQLIRILYDQYRMGHLQVRYNNNSCHQK